MTMCIRNKQRDKLEKRIVKNKAENRANLHNNELQTRLKCKF